MTRKKIRSAQAYAPVDPASGYIASDAGRASFGQVPSSREFKPDYTYVLRDLRRIVLLAGALIAILIGLSFFLK